MRRALENARFEHARALAAFRLALNLPPGTAVSIVPPAGIPDVEPDTAMAVAQALKNCEQVSEGARSKAIQSAKTEQERVALNSGITREPTPLDAHFAALQLSQARRTVNVSATADTVGTKRFEVAYSRYVAGRSGSTIFTLRRTRRSKPRSSTSRPCEPTGPRISVFAGRGTVIR